MVLEYKGKRWTKKKAYTICAGLSVNGTEGRNRTGTGKAHRFLRPTCLPIPPLRQEVCIIWIDRDAVKS